MTKIFDRLQQNWKSGLTVALVSIPLSVSLAVASQATPTDGIITAVWAGLFAAWFGGSHYNITGPTGALSGILAAYAIVHGAPALSMVALVAGVFILIAYVLKLNRFLVFVPASAMHGFTLGVAFIIALNQANFALGLDGLEKHSHFMENVIETFRHVGQTHLPTFAIFLVFLAALFAFVKFAPKIPGAIVLAPIGILLGYLGAQGVLPFELLTLGAKFPNISSLPFELPVFIWDNSLIAAGFTVAVVAILETMLSAKIADNMTKTKHNERKEVLGLGIANIITGLMGGIPATAALARTSLNVKTGANHATSAIISSVAIAIVALVLLPYFTYIPLAVIAAILVFVAMRMVETHHFSRMMKIDRIGFALALFVAFVTVYEDPIIGILVGTAISLVLLVEKISRGQFDLIVNDANKNIVKKMTGEKLEDVADASDTLVYSIKGQLAYINGQSHIGRFEKLHDYKNVVLRLRELYLIDLDGVDAFDEIVETIEKHGATAYVTGVSPLVADMLQHSRRYQAIVQADRAYPRTTDALRALGFN